MKEILGGDASTIGAGIEVCIVEDDDDLREEIELSLAELGFGVRGFSCSREFYRGLLQAGCDVAVVDLNLPDEDGLSVAAHLSGLGDVGIVILTGNLGIAERVRGLLGSADAYLLKPVDIRELAATLISVRRRVGASALPRARTASAWRLTQDDWALLAPCGKVVALTPSERVLLQLLFGQANSVVSRDDIVGALGHRADYYLDHRLDMLISRLRRKVRAESERDLPLRAVRGVGFMLSQPQR